MPAARNIRIQTHLTSKGQVVIPRAVREHLRWRPGLRLRVEISKSGAVELHPEVMDIDALLEQLSGCIKEGDALSELEADHRKEIESDEQWVRSRR